VARLGLFAYGSLVSPASAAQTLGRAVRATGPVRLVGWRRCWTTIRDNHASEKTFARRSDGSRPGHVLGLNIDPSDDPAEAPNGIVLELSEEELERLDLRELRYDRLAVGEGLERADFDEVFAYRAKPEHHAPDPPADAIVITSYASFVEAAFDALGPGQRELYVATTGPPPVEVAEAHLVVDRAIPAGNPRDW
jgi:cation transport regulator ChaC